MSCRGLRPEISLHAPEGRAEDSCFRNSSSTKISKVRPDAILLFPCKLEMEEKIEIYRYHNTSHNY